MLGYLGPAGTFSHQAAEEWSNGRYELVPFKTIHSLIKSVDTGETNIAIAPIENSIDGGINVTLDTLAFDTDVHITGEYVLHISQNLLVKKGIEKTDIKTIASIAPPPLPSLPHTRTEALHASPPPVLQVFTDWIYFFPNAVTKKTIPQDLS